MASKNNMSFAYAVLSIDIGSTAARAILAWRKGHRGDIQTEAVNFPDLVHGRHPSGCPSAILPFGNDPIKYESRENPARLEIEKLPVKFVPFVILDKIHYMQDQHPIGIRLEKERSKVGFNETTFKAVVEDASKQFLRFVLLKAKETLVKNKPDDWQIKIKTVAIPIPSLWDINFQNVYRRLLMESFAEIVEEMAPVAARDINVVFHNDATAVGYYFLHASSDAQGLRLRNDGIIPNISAVSRGINTQLFVHCGGYNASSILTTIQQVEFNQSVLSEGGLPKGAEGGTEWWIENVGEHLINRILTTTCVKREAMTPELVNVYKRQVSYDSEWIMRGDHIDLSLPYPDPRLNAGTFDTHGPTKAASDEAFEAAFRHVKRMMRNQLRRISNIKSGWGTKDHAVTIIMTGGSSLHPAFVTWMEELCAILNLPKPINLESMARFCGDAQVARGAAYATLYQQARSTVVTEAPRRRYPEFGSEEGKANERRLMLLQNPFLKPSMKETTTEARPDGTTEHPPNDNVSSSGEASTSKQMGSVSKAAGPEVSNTAGRKRKASGEPDAVVPAKLIHTTHGLPIRTASSARKDVSSNSKDGSSNSKDGSSNSKDGSST